MTINFQLPERAVVALERIANSLDKLTPPIPEERLGFRKRGIESVISYGDNSQLWRREQAGDVVKEMGMSPAEEKAYLDELLAEDGLDQ